MKALIIEASTERGIIGITHDQEIIYEKLLPVGFQQSNHLVPMIEEAFRIAGIRPNQLDCISVGVGPGSYTSIRISAAVAKSIAYACQLPLIGFCTLQAFIPDEFGPFAALIDAKIGGAYLLKGIKNREVIDYIDKPSVIPLEQLGEKITDKEILISPNSKHLSAKLRAIHPEKPWLIVENSPNLPHLNRITEEKFDRKQWSLNGDLELLYLRKTEAEYNKINLPK